MKKKMEPPNVTKVQLHVIFVLHNVRMIPSNGRKKKKKRTTKYDKSIVICDVGTIKCKKKKIKEVSNVTKVKSHVILVLHNMRMIPLNVRK